MSLKVIGAGVGRTGTLSLKLAIERLGYGPCHHMEDILQDMATQVPLWVDASQGRADWEAIYDGYQSAVDWPTARYFRELNEFYPEAKFILTHRDPDTWADSFSSTIYALLSQKDQAPAEKQAHLEMASEVVAASGMPLGLDKAALMEAFTSHNDEVKATIPANRLLIYQVKEGWAPLCDFLGVPVPEEPFPRSNNRTEFWDLVSGKNR